MIWNEKIEKRNDYYVNYKYDAYFIFMSHVMSHAGKS